MSALRNLLNVAVNVQSAQGRPLTITFSDSILKGENIAIRVELSNGCVGWGETPTFHPISAEGQPLVLTKVTEVCDMLAYQLASDYRTKGFKTLKLKVGKNLNSDIEMIRAVRKAHPDCSLILDADGGYSFSEAIQVLWTLHSEHLKPFLLLRS